MTSENIMALVRYRLEQADESLCANVQIMAPTKSYPGAMYKKRWKTPKFSLVEFPPFSKAGLILSSRKPQRTTFRDDFLKRLGGILRESQTPCFAWALMPNHFHLLLRTGRTPLSNVMRRLLTGYAVTFNLRHRRSGHLFQNQYKSILCQKAAYLLEHVGILFLLC